MARLRPAASMVTAIALGALLSAATPEEEVYLRGMEAHNNQQWSLATQEFERILRGGYEAELLYYNLGNAYYRAGDVAGAVWAYEKVLLLNP
ncbi:MAG: tetratricopeptide repeat protein, partial [Candidatus Neomarinimicrobiota bacterium]